MTRDDALRALASALREADERRGPATTREDHYWLALAERLLTPGVLEAYGLSIRDDAGGGLDR